MSQLFPAFQPCEMGDNSVDRQYGSGYGGAGFVECCEGVVDPIFLFLVIAGVHLIKFNFFIVTNKQGHLSLCMQGN